MARVKTQVRCCPLLQQAVSPLTVSRSRREERSSGSVCSLAPSQITWETMLLTYSPFRDPQAPSRQHSIHACSLLIQAQRKRIIPLLPSTANMFVSYSTHSLASDLEFVLSQSHPMKGDIGKPRYRNHKPPALSEVSSTKPSEAHRAETSRPPLSTYHQSSDR